MASEDQLQPHFLMIPLMAPGHMIPMIDMARLFANRGVAITMITTPLNASRIKAFFDRSIQSGLPIRLVQLPFPCLDMGLPEGCENFDLLPSPELAANFVAALEWFQLPVEQFIDRLDSLPTCIVSDMFLPWTSDTGRKFGIPRIVFYGPSCFSILCIYNVINSKAHESVASESDPFVVPSLPDRIEITKAQLPEHLFGNPQFKLMLDKIRNAAIGAYGVVMNSFYELESEYMDSFRTVTGRRTWSIGPVSFCNKEPVDQAERGNKAAIDKSQCLSWLDSKKPNSVVYACFGSLSHLSPMDFVEIGLGLEASKRPFILVTRVTGEKSAEIEKWLLEGFEERVKDRGLIIRGWAPQLLILSHPSTGGFLTHCGWNSALEGISTGMPMVVFPLFAEQFFNAKFIVEVLRIGVSLGMEGIVKWEHEEEVEALVKMEEVNKAVERLMDEGDEGEERRKRAKEFGEKARKAMEEGGSSYVNMALLIEDVMAFANEEEPDE